MTKTIDLAPNLLKPNNSNSRSRSASREPSKANCDMMILNRANSTKYLNEINNNNPGKDNLNKMSNNDLLIITNPSASSTSSSSNSFSSSSIYSDKQNLHIDSNNNSTELNTNNLFPKLSNKENNNQTPSPVKYGELIVLGYNGCISNQQSSKSSASGSNSTQNSSRRKSKYILKSRDKANGVKPTSQHILQSSQEVDVINLFLRFKKLGN